MRHATWIQEVTGGQSVRAIARRIDVPQRTLAYQIDRGHVSPEHIIAIAIAYGVSPVAALVDTGFIPPQYVEEGDPEVAIRQASADALAREMVRRIHDPEGDAGPLVSPVGQTPATTAPAR